MIGLPSLNTAKLYAALALALGAVVVGGLCVGVGYRWGSHAAGTSAEAREKTEALERSQAEAAALRDQLAKNRAVSDSDQRSVLNLHEQMSAQAEAANDLQRSVSHVRLVALSASRCASTAGSAVPGLDPGAAAAGGGPLVADGGGAGAGVAAAAQGVAGDVAADERVPLTLAAVGLYDGALFPGEPGAPELAAVACRAAGSPGAAADAHRCEAASGVYLDDLFRVHIANAQSCAADRERLGRLIEAVQARERIYGAGASPTQQGQQP